MVLVKKWPFFDVFFFCNIGQENVFYNFREQKKRLSSLWKQQVQKVEKLRFFPEGLTHGFGEKMAIFPFFIFLFLGNIGQENVFYNILERKNAFPAYKKKKFK